MIEFIKQDKIMCSLYYASPCIEIKRENDNKNDKTKPPLQYHDKRLPLARFMYRNKCRNQKYKKDDTPEMCK